MFNTTHRPPNTQMSARIAVPPWRNLTQNEPRTSASVCDSEQRQPSILLRMHAMATWEHDHTHLPTDVEHVEAGRRAVSLVVQEDRARAELIAAEVEGVHRGDESIVHLLRRSWTRHLLRKLSDNKEIIISNAN